MATVFSPSRRERRVLTRRTGSTPNRFDPAHSQAPPRHRRTRLAYAPTPALSTGGRCSQPAQNLRVGVRGVAGGTQYAQASTIEIRVADHGGELAVYIHDDGIGVLIPTRADRPSGLAASSPGHGLRPGRPRSRATRTSLRSTISYGAFIRHPGRRPIWLPASRY